MHSGQEAGLPGQNKPAVRAWQLRVGVHQGVERRGVWGNGAAPAECEVVVEQVAQRARHNCIATSTSQPFIHQRAEGSAVAHARLYLACIGSQAWHVGLGDGPPGRSVAVAQEDYLVEQRRARRSKAAKEYRSARGGLHAPAPTCATFILG